MHTMPRNYTLLLTSWLPVLALLSFALLMLSEYWAVGIEASPDTLAQYPFGAEGPIAGNPAYESPEAYASSCLSRVLVSLFLCVPFAVGFLKQSKRVLAVGYSLFLIAIIYQFTFDKF